MTRIARWLRSQCRFFGILRESAPLNFYMMQAVGSGVFVYCFLGKHLAVYGTHRYLGEMSYEDVYLAWPKPFAYYTTFQFLYDFLPYITPNVITGLQLSVAALGSLVLLGILPKYSAIFCFLVANHLLGIELLYNGNMDGGTTLPLCLMLVLSVSPRQSFYQLGKRPSLREKSVDYHWPVFLYLLLVSAYYTMAGLNKVVEVGPQWPLLLHLDRLAVVNTEHSLFLASWYASPFVLSLFKSQWSSVIGGVVTLSAELSFSAILFVPKSRLPLVGLMCVLHVLIFLTHGWSYLNYIPFLALCLDFNRIHARLVGEVQADG